MNYLTIVNNVLNELNEIELTATTFGSSRGVQTTVKNVVNKVHKIIGRGKPLYGKLKYKKNTNMNVYADIFSSHGNSANPPFLCDYPRSILVVTFSELFFQPRVSTTPF